MTAIVGQGTTYNLPNFVGEIFSISRPDTKFLSIIGGLSGGKKANAVYFPWQKYDLRAPQNIKRKEGADAPTAKGVVRGQVYNAMQIVQEQIALSYSKLASAGQLSGVATTGNQPVQNEMAWQIDKELKAIARDINYILINGEYAYNPADADEERGARGLMAAIETNVSNASGQALTETILLDLLQDIYDVGGISEEESALILCNSSQKRRLSKVFITDKNYKEQSRNIAGVNVTTIETDFGRLNVVLDRHMSQTQIAVVSAEMCAPVFLEVPGKGLLFVEPLAKTGSADKAQIYGEVSLEYGDEKAHGKIVDLLDPRAS